MCMRERENNRGWNGQSLSTVQLILNGCYKNIKCVNQKKSDI